MKKYLLKIFALLSLTIFLLGCTNVNNEIITEDDNFNKTSDESLDKSSNQNNNSDEDNKNNNSLNIEDRNCRIFFFDSNALKLKYTDTTIQVKDGAIIKSLTNALQNTNNNDDFLTLTKKVSIKSATIDMNTDVLKVVFSDDYTKYMTLGTATEAGLLSSLICTYGYNLGVKKVAIYFGDELYTCLRGDLPEGYFNVDYSFAEEYVKEGIDKNTSKDNIVDKNCRLFYYHCADNCYYYKDTVISVKDNSLISPLTEELKKEVKPGISILPQSLYVKSAKLDKTNDLLTVDLSSDYYDAIKNLGSSAESGILDSIMYTYCYNYDVNNFILLIDGKPYSGNHILLEDNEYFTINYDNIKDYLKPLE
ncbi:GerMN domain-containing protein [Clostridium sp. D53t1_180928_C8]|uniref:GerMN domain-containing protein n=1 Tax=Clostridium sp. D53t1_180928_C8 TaxID=2787101 RepID=UPI0018ABBD4F|nr:GerMN domain-containing protein [Clostridium sp. D53t1_180928_C8]